MDATDAADLCRLVLMQALPALAEADLAAFGDAITRLQERLGDYFAAAQGGRFASPRVAAALARLDRLGATGIGQSSWGPTGFAFARDADEARWLGRHLVMDGIAGEGADALPQILICRASTAAPRSGCCSATDRRSTSNSKLTGGNDMPDKQILHMLSPLKHVSPFDVNMALDAGYDAVLPYAGVTLDEVTGLVQDAIFSRPPKLGRAPAVFIGGKDALLALDMLEAAQQAMVPPFKVSLFADPAGSFTTAAAMVARVERTLRKAHGRELRGLADRGVRRDRRGRLRRRRDRGAGGGGSHAGRLRRRSPRHAARPRRSSGASASP